jgi:iron complex outermembrane receptor protein
LSFDPVPHLEVPVMVRNLLDARTWGFELSAEWEARPGWRLRGAYSLLKMHASPSDGSTDTQSSNIAGGSPTRQLVVRSSHDLTSSLNLDITVRAVDRLPALNVPGYVGLDVRVAWRPDENWELALVGQNLLQKDHAEFQPDLIDTRPSLVQRGVYAKLTRRF